MSQKLMTAVIFAALLLTIAAAALVPVTGCPVVSPAPQEAPRSPDAGRSGTGLDGYRDPHARTRNIATQTVSSCWIRTRYGTVDICETDGRAD